jgi:transposase
LPQAFLDEQARAIKLLGDHRTALVGERTRHQNRLRWLLHDRWPEFEIPAQALDRERWLDRVSRRLRGTEQSIDVRISRELLREVRSLSRQIKALERELSALVAERAPALLELPGCGAMSAATILAETAGPGRFPSDAKLARAAGVAADPSLLGQASAPPLGPGRQPQAQLRPASHRRHPGPMPPAGRRLPCSAPSRRQIAQGGAPGAQTPSGPGRLADVAGTAGTGAFSLFILRGCVQNTVGSQRCS